jgi:uncharacterized C2H2 Zn-finger protein/predicted RNA-binding Zn-ribbon protein involved in translation (DUF1610 family)
MCEDHFAYKPDLMKHISRIHEGEGKPYKPRVKRIGRIPQWENHKVISSLDINMPKKCLFCVAKNNETQNIKKYIDEILSFDELDKTIGKNQEANETDKCTCADLPVQDKVPIHESYDCPNCEATFTTKQTLRNHQFKIHNIEPPVSIHGGEKSYKCSMCDAAFNRIDGLKHHNLSVHDGVRYDCPNCEATFTAKHTLRRHQYNLHKIGSPPVKRKNIDCSICDIRFKRMRSLKSYMRSLDHKKKAKQNGEKSFDCPMCDYFSNSKQTLQYHISSVHDGVKYDCPYCDA